MAPVLHILQSVLSTVHRRIPALADVHVMPHSSGVRQEEHLIRIRCCIYCILLFTARLQGHSHTTYTKTCKSEHIFTSSCHDTVHDHRFPSVHTFFGARELLRSLFEQAPHAVTPLPTPPHYCQWNSIHMFWRQTLKVKHENSQKAHFSCCASLGYALVGGKY